MTAATKTDKVDISGFHELFRGLQAREIHVSDVAELAEELRKTYKAVAEKKAERKAEYTLLSQQLEAVKKEHYKLENRIVLLENVIAITSIMHKVLTGVELDVQEEEVVKNADK